MTDFAQPLARILADRSDVLFGVPGGGANLDVVGSAAEMGMRFVLAHGETEAAIMAATYGLLTGGPAGVVVTRGPGAASAVNGAAQATLDRYPLVLITDTVTAAQSPRVSHQRLDQRALFDPVTVVSITASRDTPDLDAVVDRAARWPMGTVHLDYDPEADSAETPVPSPSGENAGDADQLDRAVELLAASSCPIVIVGMEAASIDHAALAKGNPPPIASLLESLGCPVLTTYQAIGLVPTEGPLGAGLYTNGTLEQQALAQADLVLMVGVDTVEPIPTPWTQTAPVITISSVAAIDDYVPADVELNGDVSAVGRQLVEAAGDEGWRHQWKAGAAEAMRADMRTRVRPPATNGFGPLELVDAVASAVVEAGVDPTITVDAGAHFLAVMPLWPVTRPFDLLISNGLATMGFAVPAAIGASLARPGRPTLAFVGDGGLSMTMAELETIARINLPITIVVFNDAALSLIAIKQRGDAAGAHGGSAAIRYQNTDFATIARASGLDGYVAESAYDVRAILAPASGDWSRPRLIDARIDPTDYRHIIAATRG